MVYVVILISISLSLYKDSGENADNLYEIQSRKSSSLPTFSGAPYNSVLEVNHKRGKLDV